LEPVDRNIARSQGIMNIQSLHLPSNNNSNKSSCDMQLSTHFLVAPSFSLSELNVDDYSIQVKV